MIFSSYVFYLQHQFNIMEQEREELVKNLKIGRFLEKLPSQHLASLIRNKDQLKSFLSHRNHQKLVSLAWTARFTGQDNPLDSLLKTKQINRNTYNLVLHTVDWYEQLWGLVQLSEPHVQARVIEWGFEYPFKSAFELFVRILYDSINADFSICIKGYQEFSTDKFEKAFRLVAKACTKEIDSEQEKFLRRTLPQSGEFCWLTLLLAICHFKVSTRRTPLKSKLEDFYIVSERLFELEATTCRKAKSFAWKDGKKGKGTKSGTYDFS